MGTAILRGISTGLLVTLLTLLGGVIWETMGLGGLKVTSLVDVGLFLSCLIGGFRAARDGGHWVIGAVAGAGYVAVSTLLLALFAPVSGTGVVKLLAEGALLGGLGGVIGTGVGGGIKVRPAGNRGRWWVDRENDRENDRYDAYRGREYRSMDYEHAGKSYNGKDWANDDPDLANDDQNQANPLQDQADDYRSDAINLDADVQETADHPYSKTHTGNRAHPWWEEEIGGIKRIG